MCESEPNESGSVRQGATWVRDYAGDMTDLLLAQPERPDPTTWVGPGLLCLAILLVIALAMVLLWKNMNKQISKIDFDEGGNTNGNEPHARAHS